MSPPLPIPKSYQQLSVVSTLNDGVCSCRNGDLYQSFVPFLAAGSCPSEDRKSASGMFLISLIIILFLVSVDVFFGSIALIYTPLNYTVPVFGMDQ